jgi:hypothetical protein
MWMPRNKRPARALGIAKLAQEGDALHATTGPAATYWMNDAKASGDYTVKATVHELKI